MKNILVTWLILGMESILSRLSAAGQHWSAFDGADSTCGSRIATVWLLYRGLVVLPVCNVGMKNILAYHEYIYPHL